MLSSSQFVRLTSVLFSVVAVSIPSVTFAATLEADTPPQIKAGPPSDRALPTVAVKKTAVTALKTDRNNNGLSDGLEAKLARLGAADAVDVIVTFRGPGNAAAAQAAVGAFSVKHEFRLINAFSATMSAAQARALAAAPGVFRVEDDSTVTAMLEAARHDYGVTLLRQQAATAGVPAETGAGVVACVPDTGAFYQHEQFNDTTAGTNQIVAFKDFIGDSTGTIRTDAYDDFFHGTHVSAIIAGLGKGSALGTRLGGVAPGAKLAIAKVLDYNGSGSDSGVMTGLEWCASSDVSSHGTRTVINLSLGIPGSSDGNSALEQLIDVIAHSGIVVVVAAGNSGAAPYTVGSPGASREAISVGAAGDYSANPNDAWAEPFGLQSAAPFSSRGPTADGRIKPDIMGPGSTIASAGIENANLGIAPCPQPCYVVASGTSMATPFVTGVVALMLGENPSLTTDQVRTILYTTTKDEFPGGGKDNETGFGLVNAHAAVRAAQSILVGEADAHTFPGTAQTSVTVARNGQVLLPVYVTDPSLPVMATIMIEGSVGVAGWTPDIDAALLDANLQSFDITPLLPGVVWPGTASTCPAGDFCGAQGRVETLYIHPGLGAPFNRTLVTDGSAPSYYIQLYPYDGWPNNGKGGAVSVELFNATTGVSGEVSVPYSPIVASAGSDISVASDPATGTAVVALDGSNSTGAIATYSWSADTIGPLAEGMFAAVELPVGNHLVTLTVDGTDGTSTDSLNVAVSGTPSVVHDVAVTSVSAPTSALVNTAETVSVTVMNQGTEPETFNVALTDTLAATIGAPQSVTLGAGASQTLGFSWTPTATGDHALTATADVVAGETDTADNQKGATVTVTDPPNAAPVASFSFSPANPETGQMVTFTDASNDSDGSIASWSWDFGDGNTSTAQNPSHAYASAGAHTVTLTVTDNDGATGSDSQVVTVSAPVVHDVAVTSVNAPTSALVNTAESVLVTVVNQGTGLETFNVALSDSLAATVDGPQSVTLGAGASLTLGFSWTPTIAGTHTLTATADVVAGETYTVNNQNIATVTVTDPPNAAPVASFSYSPLSPEAGLSVNFTDASNDSDGSIASWSWDFGDGNTSTAQNPSHTFAAAGTFSVTLTVTDNDGATGSDTQVVTVTAPAGGGSASVLSVSYCGVGGRSSMNHLVSVVTITDASGPVANVSVNATITEDGTGTMTRTATTDVAGQVQFKWTNATSGSHYTTTVNSLDGVADGMTDAGVTWPSGGPCG